MRDAMHCLMRKWSSRYKQWNIDRQWKMLCCVVSLYPAYMWVTVVPSVTCTHQIDTFYRLKDFICSSSTSSFYRLSPFSHAATEPPILFYITCRIANKSRRIKWMESGERNQEKNARKSTTLYAKRTTWEIWKFIYLLLNRTGWTRA